MPELPEVETVRRGLQPHLEGAVLARVDVRRPDLRVPFPPGFARRLEGRRIVSLDRRAKYLLARLDDGTTVIMHLGMSGRFTVEDQGIGRFHHDAATAQGGLGLHDHVVLETDAGTRIVYTDHRRFGLMTLAEPEALDAHPLIRDLGIEPLGEELTAERLQAMFRGRSSPLKAALLDQKLIAGLGNIYVCEALYRAHLSPRRRASTVGAARAERLVEAIRTTLEQAIRSGGSSLRDYAQADGSLGYFQHAFRVYGREGDICPDRGCGPIQRIVQSNRSTFFCPGCQR